MDLLVAQRQPFTGRQSSAPHFLCGLRQGLPSVSPLWNGDSRFLIFGGFSAGYSAIESSSSFGRGAILRFFLFFWLFWLGGSWNGNVEW
ncbi:hypothetical protein BDV26DRAFT_158867 [Aspergillus bertholletiae]|uniref:Uncharacterized protein n=1 Tax=Aspergillus bertholletiae TaxID=1226010 RepID=A0A5N7BD22_9EURO|nr:hypothetical protein BDV26DRAFT_158867 [Aspergillus bertholletiae]